MKFTSINPFTNQLIKEYPPHSAAEVQASIHQAHEAFLEWRQLPIQVRSELLEGAGEVLLTNLEEYAQLITAEMGKPIIESRAEIKKCAWVCDFYAKNASEFLADQLIESDAQLSLVQNHPLGVIFAVMPWNFPFWQVFRFAVPTLAAGNTGLLKHASNVSGCALKIEEVFKKAGFPEGVFKTLLVSHDQTEAILANPIIKAVSLTGSEAAGSAVATLAGKHLKKSLLELGGNNAFIVWEDADLDQAVATAIAARMLNAGQSCIAAKRFILVAEIYDAFVDKFITAAKKLKMGNPIQSETTIGPLARVDLAEKLQDQIQKSIAKGAKLLFGGKQENCFHQPTVLGEVIPGMAVFEEETFGPVASMIKAKDAIHAFQLSNQSVYGLGVSLFTKNIEKALEMSSYVSDGAYFINELVKSDPRLPFGGTKLSGYGRELSRDGILEFVNRKTIFIK